MPRVRIKICGIRTLDEATVAVDAGADALGFNFWDGSPRYISSENALDIIARVSPLVSCIGVFVNQLGTMVASIADSLRLSAVQLHGDESVEDCAELHPRKIIKAFRVGPDFQPETIVTYPISAALLDAKVPGRYGGTGATFGWEAAVAAKQFAPVILAGGLKEDNVEQAILQVRPAAIDVCSGVESEPGKKDLRKLERFLAVAQHANAKL